ncbi:MAG: tetratricopeptide repeat protein [Saprospiraceae bacterium]|nr:tetratricopeptide repeat protein [Saprospiraceae bacterium]
MGILYFGLKNYQKAEQYYFSALKVREKVLGKEHIDCIGTLINLGILYHATGNLEKEEQVLLNSKMLLEFNNEYINHPYYSNCLIRLGIFYTDIGNFKMAEFCIKNSNKLNEKLFVKYILVI